VIGNVPFAKVTPHDPRHNRRRHTLHNYFICKSLHLTRPGGMVVVLTSRYTLDARNPAARREMDTLADLVGAMRLPAGAFAESSGTDVVCDMIVLRRRPDGHARAGPPWVATVPAPLPDAGTDPLYLNEYLAADPRRILGTLTADRGMYRQRELTVAPAGVLEPALIEAVGRVVQDASARGLGFEARSAGDPVASATDPPPASFSDAAGRFAQEGSFLLLEGRLARVEGGESRPYRPRFAADRAELERLIRLRDAARAVLAAQVAGAEDAQLEPLQRDLTARYDAYVARHGPLNRYRAARSGRTDPDTGEEIVRRIRPRLGGFRDDPDWPLVAALEVFDDSTQQAKRAPIFTERVVAPPVQRLGVDTAAEAMAVCLDETGALSLDRIADLLGTDPDGARGELEGLAYQDPATASWVPASRYLSGDIRRKVTDARTAAETDPRWEPNIAALAAVLPRQLEPGEITAGLGAPWIPPDDIESFCAEVFGADVEVERVAALGRWSVALRAGRRGSVSLSSEWGTARADAVTLLDASLNQRLHTVTDESDDGRRVRNDAETIAARDKQDALAARFASWVWEDPARAARLARRYNELFRSVVVPTHDGAHLSLPGLSDSFRPHPHQRDAVARILTEGRALLAHAVGAGKTATMVMAAMELRRLGMAAKPAVVVPNHMLDQFTREWLQLYPTARLLVADRDRLSKERREQFVARCATGEWDAVLFTHAGFGRLPLGSDLLAAYLGDELDRCRQALGESRAGKALSVKRLERRIAQLEETYQRLLAAETKDDGVRFEETGVDYLFVDEGHLFKNRRVDSAIDGMAAQGSQRAQDLDAKLWALRRAHGPRVVTFATATPVANSIVELWTMQSYLQPDVLAHVDLTPFDAWAATFGRTVTALELAPDGASYRMQSRFARFQNVPELLTLYRQVADVRTSDDLRLPVPGLADGRAETVVVPPTGELRAYVGELAARAEAVRAKSVLPDEDNMLKITGDGRRAALDLRLVGVPAAVPGPKVVAAAERIAAIHHASRSYRYLDAVGDPHPRPGALQLVFCDVSTPAATGWNAYDELRALLVARGLPADKVRFIHEAGSDQAKANLFAACRDGRVAVLVGSTDKMGVGTNVQARAIALHHLDCPWRPADIEQREGRILRQGNQNATVSIHRYAVEGSFDIYMWQTVERKAVFINQVATGRTADREVEDIGDQALSYAEVKALATGNPLILEKAGVDADVARLGRLRRAHVDDQHRLRRALDSAEARARTAAGRISQLESAIARRTDTRGELFSVIVDGARHTKRAEAGAHLHRLVGDRLAHRGPRCGGEVGRIGGFAMHVGTDAVSGAEVRVAVPDAGIELRYAADEWRNVDPLNLVQRLERRLQSLDAALADTRHDHAAAEQEADRARARIGLPFDHEADLQRLRRRQQEITEQLLPGPDAAPEEASVARRMADRLASAATSGDGLARRSPSR
jgi:N12 class adenine-specific DNA methylase